MLLAGPFQRFFVFFCISMCTFSPFFFLFLFFSFVSVCVRVLRARHRGRARHRRGCQRVVAGRGREGVARSTVAVFAAWRRVCVETRGKHELTLSGLLLWSRLYHVRVYKGRFDLQNKFQAEFIETKLKTNERATQSEHQLFRDGERRPR